MPLKKNNKNKKKSVDALLEIELRRQYYKDGANFTKNIAIVTSIALAIALIVATIAVTKKTETRYVATNQDGSIMKMITLNKPNQSDATVRSWMIEAMVNTFQTDYVNYKTDMNNSIQKYFTESGGNGLTKSLEDIDLFETIRKRRMLVTFDVVKSPVLIKKGLIGTGGEYGWLFQSKGRIILRNEKESFVINVNTEITVSRRSLLIDPKGLGIAKVYIVKERK